MRWRAAISPGPGRTRLPVGRGGCPRGCGPRPTRSCWRRPRREPRLRTWRRSPPPRSSSGAPPRPDPEDDFDFRDRHVRLGRTFGGAGVIRGDLTPECAAAVSAVIEALGKKRGREDDRNEGQRFHDALAEACHLLLRARLVPDRAGADTQVIVHIPISQLRQIPGAPELEDAWLKARLGEPGRPGRRLPGRPGRGCRRLRRADRPGRHRPRRHDGDRQDHRARLVLSCQ